MNECCCNTGSGNVMWMKFRMDQDNTVEPSNNIGLYDTSFIAPDILLYQLIPHC
jgi:hypothetical protein